MEDYCGLAAEAQSRGGRTFRGEAGEQKARLSFEFLSFVFFLISGVLPEVARATPQVIRVDGSVFDASGAALTASKDIQIKAYDAASGGSLLWTSSTYNTPVSSGRFTINLDAAAGSPSLVDRLGERTASQAVYFQIEVDSGAANGSMDTPIIVLPRVRSKGTAFALSAVSADRIRGYAVSTATPSSQQVLTWNSTSSWWEPANAPGKDATYPTEASRRSSAAISIYVRSDGDDLTCNGSVNASSASAPSCSFASLQSAIDALPEVILHPVTVNVAAGTYRAATSGAVLAKIQKTVAGNGRLTVAGSGSVIFSGATSGSPTTPVGDVGVDVYAPSSLLTFTNLTFAYFKVAGMRFNSGSSAILSGVTASNNDSTSASGILVQQARLELTGTVRADSNKYGIYGKRAQIYTNTANVGVYANSNSDTGVFLTAGTEYLAEVTTATLTANSNANDGLAILYSSILSGPAVTASSNVAGSGLSVLYGSAYNQFQGVTTTANSNAISGLACEKSSTCDIYAGLLTLNSNSQSNLRVRYGSVFTVNGAANLTLTGTNVYGAIEATDQAQLSLWSTGTYTLNRGSLGAGTGIYLDRASNLMCSAGTHTISQFQTYGVRISNGSSFWDYGSGTKTISNATTSVSVAELSVFTRGAWTTGTCDASSRCN